MKCNVLSYQNLIFNAFFQNHGVQNSRCCGYGVQGVDTMTGFDCLIIPNAVKAGGSSQLIGNQFCGRFLVTATNQASGKTICSKQFF